jgi:hypothetical protein
LLKCAVIAPGTPLPSSSSAAVTPSGTASTVPASAQVAALPAGALGLSLGSRAHLEKESTAQRALYRTVRAICGRPLVA